MKCFSEEAIDVQIFFYEFAKKFYLEKKICLDAYSGVVLAGISLKIARVIVCAATVRCRKDEKVKQNIPDNLIFKKLSPSGVIYFIKKVTSNVDLHPFSCLFSIENGFEILSAFLQLFGGLHFYGQQLYDSDFPFSLNDIALGVSSKIQILLEELIFDTYFYFPIPPLASFLLCFPPEEITKYYANSSSSI